jgi:hypothetical protein
MVALSGRETDLDAHLGRVQLRLDLLVFSCILLVNRHPRLEAMGMAAVRGGHEFDRNVLHVATHEGLDSIEPQDAFRNARFLAGLGTWIAIPFGRLPVRTVAGADSGLVGVLVDLLVDVPPEDLRSYLITAPYRLVFQQHRSLFAP